MIYLDYNATTPVDARVLVRMLPYFSEKFGNAASKTHAAGWVADAAVEIARENVAKLIGASSHEIIFTSGATESINLALLGAYEARESKDRNHLITVKTEHNAVLDTCKHLEKRGAVITYLNVDREGIIDLTELKNSISASTLMVCVMLANNETGVLQPMQEISEIVHAQGCMLMSDATQAVGKMVVNVDGIDLLACSSHKIYGPKGAGALFVRRKNPRVSLAPLLYGGGHERGLRSGTLNVPAIVGFGKACEIAEEELWEDAQRMSKLRTTLEQGLMQLGNVFVNGGMRDRLPNVTNLAIRGVKADELIAKLPDMAFSTGSACTSALAKPSHVLTAMGLSEEVAYASVRFSLGKITTTEEVETALEKVRKTVIDLRA